MLVNYVIYPYVGRWTMDIDQLLALTIKEGGKWMATSPARSLRLASKKKKVMSLMTKILPYNPADYKEGVCIWGWHFTTLFDTVLMFRRKPIKKEWDIWLTSLELWSFFYSCNTHTQKKTFATNFDFQTGLPRLYTVAYMRSSQSDGQNPLEIPA